MSRVLTRRELLHQVDALLEEMINLEQLENLVREQKRRSGKVGQAMPILWFILVIMLAGARMLSE